MMDFEFSKDKKAEAHVFVGYAFYNIYKHAEFLRSGDNVETILSKGYELRQQLKNVEPGSYLTIKGMMLERHTPLLIKKTGPNVTVEEFEFTYNRLTGLVAAYVFQNRHRFPAIKASEAIALGLLWENTDEVKCRLYLSAVSGTEHFTDQFMFWPLICALRKLQMKKITVEPVIKMAKIKNDSGKKMCKLLLENYSTVVNLWTWFPDANRSDLKTLLQTAPQQLKCLFVAEKK